jgi:peptidoglycan/LPS O-acetylase OafA/YrhL
MAQTSTTDVVAGPSQAGPRARIAALDGLRGVGALVVVVHHALLVLPALAVLYVPAPGGERVSPPAWSLEWWLYDTPLRLVWAGHEAVLVFFVLSGFVLTAPLTGGGRGGRAWIGYYLRRLCRLYVPVWASLLLASAAALLVPRDHTGGTWLARHPAPTTEIVLNDAVLLRGTTFLNSPLWSLQWEVLFSLLLPIMFAALRFLHVHRWPEVAAAGLAAIAAVAQIPAVRQQLPQAWLSVGALTYLPIFAIGMVIAMSPGRVQLVRDLLGAGRGRSAGWMVAGLLLAVSPTYLGPDRSTTVAFVQHLASAVGVTMIVLSALTAPAVIRFLERRPLQVAGSRSYSLYLVHEPILVSVAIAAHTDGYLPWLIIAPAAIASAFLVAELFFRLVERPAIRLSRRLDATATSRPVVG